MLVGHVVQPSDTCTNARGASAPLREYGARMPQVLCEDLEQLDALKALRWSSPIDPMTLLSRNSHHARALKRLLRQASRCQAYGSRRVARGQVTALGRMAEAEAEARLTLSGIVCGRRTARHVAAAVRL